jgi:CHASE1-domain containing sensor protein
MESPPRYPAAVRLAQAIHNRVSVWLILALSLLLTIGAYLLSERFVERRAADRFEFQTRDLQNAISTRIHLYEQLLWSGAALMNASTEVTREDFRLFVTTLAIDLHWPGIQGVGFSRRVPAAHKQAHVDAIRAEGFPDYQIRPEGERETYSAIVFLEPFDWRNQRAFGYDMYSNPTRREAMERARDSGQAATSGLITLVQETTEDVQPGFLIYVPVYSSKAIPATVEQRRAQLEGWIYAPFRMGNLMHGILGNSEKHIQFDIYDGIEIRDSALLYTSAGRAADTRLRAPPAFSKTVQLKLQGRPWMLVMRSTDQPDADNPRSLPRYVAMAGIMIDLLLFYVILSLHFINRRAEALAQSKTDELEQARHSLEQQVQQRTLELEQARNQLEQAVQERTRLLQEKIHELETLNMVTVGREERIMALKAEVNDLCVRLGIAPPYESVQ